MDEIDAALDFRNVSIVAYYIKDRTKNTCEMTCPNLSHRLIGIWGSSGWVGECECGQYISSL